MSFTARKLMDQYIEQQDMRKDVAKAQQMMSNPAFPNDLTLWNYNKMV